MLHNNNIVYCILFLKHSKRWDNCSFTAPAVCFLLAIKMAMEQSAKANIVPYLSTWLQDHNLLHTSRGGSLV